MSRKQFLSTGAPASTRVWDAMRAAGEAVPMMATLSQQADAAFQELFGRECSALDGDRDGNRSVLRLGTMAQPHGGVICPPQALLEMDEGGAPGSLTTPS
jgi:threonine aldolase